MARYQLAAITQWITEAATAHPHDLADHLMKRLAISRSSALRLLQRLVASQWLVREGTPRRPHHRPGLLRQVVRRYALERLDEHGPWARDFAPQLALGGNLARLAQHVFTELLNNAIDHSGGSSVTISMRQTPAHLQLLVSDDGCGLFERIGSTFAIQDPTLAMLELSKGKLSSQPERHTGRGLFFASRIADVLDLHANARAFQHRRWQPNQWRSGRPATQQGTSVFAAIALDSTCDLDTLLRAHSADGQGYGFERTVVPMHLLADTPGGLESRAQARHVAARLAQFRCAELDFQGIDHVGHSFADELFRVFGREYPALDLVAKNTTARVAAMLASVRPLG